MTAVERVAAVLRECGAANAWLDDSACDGGWQVDTSDAWYRETAGAVLEALEGRWPKPLPGGCPRCGSPRPRPSFDVCARCAAELGWDPECRACLLEQKGEDPAGVEHVPTCGGVHG